MTSLCWTRMEVPAGTSSASSSAGEMASIAAASLLGRPCGIGFFCLTSLGHLHQLARTCSYVRHWTALQQWRFKLQPQGARNPSCRTMGGYGEFDCMLLTASVLVSRPYGHTILCLQTMQTSL